MFALTMCCFMHKIFVFLNGFWRKTFKFNFYSICVCNFVLFYLKNRVWIKVSIQPCEMRDPINEPKNWSWDSVNERKSLIAKTEIYLTRKHFTLNHFSNQNNNIINLINKFNRNQSSSNILASRITLPWLYL